ncbi:hypothetical protein Taro_051689 [Colocasia esculenta]|uniref:Uncharacterized protein n=1 Tax=Colocasia esculenta TaxID=4460 RepID=A0A843XHH8_COLES|nr:hypothetical protein [Colocasia esculenta]
MVFPTPTFHEHELLKTKALAEQKSLLELLWWAAIGYSATQPGSCATTLSGSGAPGAAASRESLIKTSLFVLEVESPQLVVRAQSYS